MCTPEPPRLQPAFVRAGAMLLLLAMIASGSQAQTYGLGRPVTEAALEKWAIDVDIRGNGLPAGRGSARDGAAVFAAKCAACHGAQGEGKPADALVGGAGTLKNDAPQRTVGSYWPFATTLFDYVRRAMPYDAPQSLSADEVYAVSAWILWRNGIVGEDHVLDAQSLPRVRMPNREGFVPDPRPDVTNVAWPRLP